MIRLILAVISIALFFIVSCLMVPVEWVVGKISPKARDLSRFRIVQGYLKVLLFLCGVKAEVIGKEKIPADRPVLYTPNHRGMFDIVLLLSLFPGLTGFISKKEWEKVPLLSWWIRWTYGLFLDRKDLKQGLKVILAAIENVKGGISMAVFPEGTRSRTADETQMLPFHEGSFKIAAKTGCPIVPVAISHTSRILEDHFPRIKGTRVIIEFGDPIDPEALTKEEKKFLGRYTQSIIREMLSGK